MTSPLLTEPSGLTMAQAVEATGLSEDTLRYYEKMGLVRPHRDPSSRHRRYSQQQINWLKFLIHLRSTGMPLESIQRYIELALQGESSAQERKAILEGHRDNVLGRIEQLQQALAAIEVKLEHYADIEKLLKTSVVLEATGGTPPA